MGRMTINESTSKSWLTVNVLNPTSRDEAEDRAAWCGAAHGVQRVGHNLVYEHTVGFKGSNHAIWT